MTETYELKTMGITTIQATNNLRFVERPIADGPNLKLVRILQQDHIVTTMDATGKPIQSVREWRDVPLELEG